MIRYWLNLRTLAHRINDLEYGVARIDAEKWLGAADLGWFANVEAMNIYIVDQVLPVLREAWISSPHMRLGQLVANVINGRNVYAIPDGELRDSLAKWSPS